MKKNKTKHTKKPDNLWSKIEHKPPGFHFTLPEITRKALLLGKQRGTWQRNGLNKKIFERKKEIETCSSFFKKFKKQRFTVMVFEFGIVVFVSALPIFSSVVGCLI